MDTGDGVNNQKIGNVLTNHIHTVRSTHLLGDIFLLVEVEGRHSLYCYHCIFLHKP